MHSFNIIHRDIKPRNIQIFTVDNILINFIDKKSGTISAKIADFGLSRSLCYGLNNATTEVY